jgi:hypothetical protein
VDTRKAFRLWLQFIEAVKRVNTGEIQFVLKDGRRARISFCVEEVKPRLYMCHEPEETKEKREA